jgi:hypothetical protein
MVAWAVSVVVGEGSVELEAWVVQGAWVGVEVMVLEAAAAVVLEVVRGQVVEAWEVVVMVVVRA